MKPGRAFVVVGRGRMGNALAHALRANARVVLLSSRTLSPRTRRPRGGPITWIFAVRDAAIASTAATLSSVLSPGDVALHLAGMLGPDVLADARTAGAMVASLHPLFAIAGGRNRASLDGCVFTFEGQRGALPEARRIARAVQGTVIVARDVDRARYHGAAALVATGAVALAQGAAALLGDAIIPSPTERERRAGVGSLLRSVAANVEDVGVEAALASPLLRDDVATVRRHLDAMRSRGPVRALYRAAVAMVIDALDAQGTVRRETLTAARAVVAEP